MKNFSKKNFSGKNNKEYKKNSDFGYYSKNSNRSKKNDIFLNNSSKNKNVEEGKIIECIVSKITNNGSVMVIANESY